MRIRRTSLRALRLTAPLAALLIFQTGCDDDDTTAEIDAHVHDHDSGTSDTDSGTSDTDSGTSDTDSGTSDTDADTPEVDANITPPPPPSKFSSEGVRFEVSIPAQDGQPVCYDFDTEATIGCDQEGVWDLKVDVDLQTRAYNLWTNGGIYGTGSGGALGPMDAEYHAQFSSMRDIPATFPDSIGGIFGNYPWQEYGIDGFGPNDSHQLMPNGRVYAVKTATATYRVQLTSYYHAGSSGMVTLRYANNETPTSFKDVVLDASAGGFTSNPDPELDRAAYFDLDLGEVVPISDEEAKTNEVWDIAIKRYTVTLNGGVSGSAGVTGAILNPKADFYEDGKPVADAFFELDDETMEADFVAEYDEPSARSFILDSYKPYITNDGGTQSWWSFIMPPGGGMPEFIPQPEIWWVVFGAEGTSAAKVHAVEVDVDHARGYDFTFELFIEHKNQ